MNVRTQNLLCACQKLEGIQNKSDPWRPEFHVSPPVGWMNDPNGLCQIGDTHHLFFQYSPFDTKPGLNYWGHFSTRDFVHYTYQEPALCSDEQFDCHGVYSGSVLVEQPEGKAFVIFDENNLRHAIAAGEDQPQPQLTMPFGASHFPATMEEAKADMLPALEKHDGVLFMADTVEKLAEQIGVPAEKLRETIETYNHAAETGMDWDCYKPAEWLTPMNEAPYYAVKAGLGTDGAFGGVEIDEHMQAKAADGGLVDGLFVVGDLASGRFLNMAGIKKQILNDMSFAVSSGYVAGTYAAQKY